VFRKIASGFCCLIVIAMLGVDLGVPKAYANKVDCAKVMAEVTAGKKTSEIAKDLSISTSSVYRCKKKARAKASPMASTASSPATMSSPSGSKPK
jgi:hypothetical protein